MRYLIQTPLSFLSFFLSLILFALIYSMSCKLTDVHVRCAANSAHIYHLHGCRLVSCCKSFYITSLYPEFCLSLKGDIGHPLPWSCRPHTKHSKHIHNLSTKVKWQVNEKSTELTSCPALQFLQRTSLHKSSAAHLLQTYKHQTVNIKVKVSHNKPRWP